MSLEALARSMAGRLTYDADHQNDYDRLLAVALGSVVPGPFDQDVACRRTAREATLNSLGKTLVALKLAGRLDLFNRSVIELKDCLRWRLKATSQRDRLKIAKAVIQEWVDDTCRQCHGARHVFDHNGVKMDCLVCGKTGKHRFSDHERSESLGVDNPEKWNRAMGIGHFQVSFAVDFAKRNAYEKLRAETEVRSINT